MLLYTRNLSSSIMDGPNKLECYITLDWIGSPVTNNLVYWAHSEAMKKMNCCEYDSMFFTSL